MLSFKDFFTENKLKNCLSEELNYHLDNGISLVENVFRIYSEKYFDVINEARIPLALKFLSSNSEK
jgi:hypothetical protein